jgi:cytochrome c2
MKIEMTNNSLYLKLFIFLFTCLNISLSAQEVDLAAGKTLFVNQCASCHAKDMKSDLTGPALAGVEERWADYPREDLYSWIRNSQAMISAGHPRAKELWAEWGPTIMNNFPAFSDQDMENILAYINEKANEVPKVAVTAVPGEPVEKSDNRLMFLALFIILGLLALVLARIVANLNYMAQVQAGNEDAERKTLADILTSKGFISFAIFLAVVIGGFMTVNNAINLGRQQGYQPDQPIKFSHVTHAGMNKIDCKYCHDGARRSKHSVIPAANTCMNCHKAIEKGSKYGTAELTKIFASIGYDPSTDKYIENYDELSTEEIEKIYKKWIADEYVKDNSTLDREGERLIEDQWEGIVAALTDPDSGDDKIQGPIEWVRIHNLPDHVYFNHAQHVTVGKVECQQCHGKVEEMEVVAQYSPLSMGWCINCHRETEVQFADNEYYKSFEIYHEELAKGKRTGVTVEEVGGLECQKCHY